MAVNLSDRQACPRRGAARRGPLRAPRANLCRNRRRAARKPLGKGLAQAAEMGGWHHHAAGSRRAERGIDRFPPPTKAWLGKLAALGEFATVPPQRYRRQALVPDIDIYSDASIPSGRKGLILGFSGAAGQLMIPTPVFLQYVSSERYDVVVLRDRTKQGYAIGIPPYAHNLWDLAQKLTAEIGAATYRRVYPYGTSMGGFRRCVAACCSRPKPPSPEVASSRGIRRISPETPMSRPSIRSATATRNPRRSSSAITAPAPPPTSRVSRCCNAPADQAGAGSKRPATPFSASCGARDGCGGFTTGSSATTSAQAPAEQGSRG